MTPSAAPATRAGSVHAAPVSRKTGWRRAVKQHRYGGGLAACAEKGLGLSVKRISPLKRARGSFSASVLDSQDGDGRPENASAMVASLRRYQQTQTGAEAAPSGAVAQWCGPGQSTDETGHLRSVSMADMPGMRVDLLEQKQRTERCRDTDGSHSPVRLRHAPLHNGPAFSGGKTGVLLATPARNSSQVVLTAGRDRQRTPESDNTVDIARNDRGPTALIGSAAVGTSQTISAETWYRVRVPAGALGDAAPTTDAATDWQAARRQEKARLRQGG